MLHISLTCFSPHKGVCVSTLKVKKSKQGVTVDTLLGFIINYNVDSLTLILFWRPLVCLGDNILFECLE